MPNVSMPSIDLNKVVKIINEEEYNLLNDIIKAGKLKKTPPKLEYTTEYINGLKRRFIKEDSGKKVYLWKALAYYISPFLKDMAVPPSLQYKMYVKDKETANKLDNLANIVKAAVPDKFHYGTITRGK